MNVDGDRKDAVSEAGEQNVLQSNDGKKRAPDEAIESHTYNNRGQSKKYKPNEEEDYPKDVSTSSEKSDEESKPAASTCTDDNAAVQGGSLDATTSTNDENKPNRTDSVVEMGQKDDDNCNSELSSTCSSPVQALSPTLGLEEKEFARGSAASITSVASSNSSSSSFLCPPAPPTTPITAPYGVPNAFYNVSTPKPDDTTLPSPAGFPELPSDEAMRSRMPHYQNQNSNNHSSQSSSETTSKSDERKPIELSDDFASWNSGPRYELMRILGRGSYGEVAQAKDLHATQPGSMPKYVAIKKISTAFQQDVDALRLFREIHLLKGMRGHDCIIQLVDIVAPGSEEALDDLYLVFEYVDTDLYKLIMSPQYLTTAHIRTFLYQMLKGLKHLHSSSIIHRDLKPANILLNEDCSLKICDFGLARIVDSSQVAKGSDDVSSSVSTNQQEKKAQGLTRQLTKHVVTRWYRAPELILIQQYTTAVDIWSVGCIFAELLSMQEGSVPSYEDRVPLFPGGSCFPLSGDSNPKASERLDQLSVIFGVIGTPAKEDIESIGSANQYIKTLKKSPSKSIEDIYPAADAQAIDLLKKMLQFNPSKRCTADEALNHVFLEDVRQVEKEKKVHRALIGPDFLNSDKISIEEIKKRIREEVLWFKGKEAN